MILFTGHGEIASHYLKNFEGKIISFRKLSIEEIKEIIPKYKVIIHNSANINPKDTDEAINDNFLLTKAIVDVTSKANTPIKLIYLSSMSILKNEDQYSNPNEMSNYALSKYFAELYCLRSQMKDLKIVRFSTIFYQKEIKDGLSKLIYEAVKNKKITLFNNGEAKRDFLPIQVLSQYLNRLIYRNNNTKIINFCSGSETSFWEVATILKATIPDLVIENQNSSFPNVLSKFSSDNLNELGTIDFNITEYIVNYISRLNK